LHDHSPFFQARSALDWPSAVPCARSTIPPPARLLAPLPRFTVVLPDTHAPERSSLPQATKPTGSGLPLARSVRDFLCVYNNMINMCVLEHYSMGIGNLTINLLYKKYIPKTFTSFFSL
jgi:hypothetical protein